MVSRTERKREWMCKTCHRVRFRSTIRKLAKRVRTTSPLLQNLVLQQRGPTLPSIYRATRHTSLAPCTTPQPLTTIKPSSKAVLKKVHSHGIIIDNALPHIFSRSTRSLQSRNRIPPPLHTGITPSSLTWHFITAYYFLHWVSFS